MNQPEQNTISAGEKGSQEAKPKTATTLNKTSHGLDDQAVPARVKVESRPRGFKAIGPPARCM
jgi:hypothetical protein